MSATLPAAETAAALTGSVVGRVVHSDVVLVTGPDAESYLQGQCSQDLAGMAPGEGRFSLLLSPQGKLVALVRVVALGEHELAVEVAAGHGEPVLERLARFKLRVKAALELQTWRRAEVRGPRAAEALARLGDEPPRRAVVAVHGRFGEGFDLLGPEAELPAGLAEGDPAAFEAARIEAGLPAMGSELDERVMPPEAGIVAETVSLTKGCYTGQELVARLDARGNRVPRILRGVLLGGTPGSLPAPGSELVEAGPPAGRAGEQATDRSAARPSGRLTSVAWSYRLGTGVALAYVRREVVPPATLELRAARDDGEEPAGGPGEEPAGGHGEEPARRPVEVVALPL